jgi:hypothetical protein
MSSATIKTMLGFGFSEAAKQHAAAAAERIPRNRILESLMMGRKAKGHLRMMQLFVFFNKAHRLASACPFRKQTADPLSHSKAE